MQSKSLGVRYILKKEVIPGEELQVGVAVSTRLFPGSVQRNRVKRLLKEAWRLNKPSLQDKMTNNGQLIVFFIYTANEIREFSTLENEMQNIIRKFENLVSR